MKTKTNILYSCLIAVFAFYNTAHAQESKYEALTKNLVAAMNSLDSKAIIALIDDSCKISTFPRGINDRLIPLIFNQKFSAISDYTILKQVKETTGTRVYIAAKYGDGRDGKPDFLFAENGKAIELNIVKSVPVAPKVNPGTQQLTGIIPDSINVPFEIFDKLIFLTVEINGKKGRLQFDSGAAVTILQGDILSQANLKPVAVGPTVTGINGASQLGQLRLDSLTLGKMKIRGFDVNTLAGAKRSDSWGLLGYDFLNAFEVKIDYKQKRMTLIHVDSAGNYLNPAIKRVKPISSAPIVMQRHIPIINLSILGRDYPMGLDYGANSNLFFSEHYAQLKSALKEESKVEMFGLGDKTVMVKSAALTGIKVGKLKFDPMLTVFTENNMANANTPDQLRINGILGYPFLSQYVISINFKKGLVSFY